MHTPSSDREVLASGAPSLHTSQCRLLIGLIQGLLLYGLYQSDKLKVWPASHPQVFAPLLLLAVFVPLLAISGWGRLSRRGLSQWLLVATVLVGSLGWYDLWRMNPVGDGGYNAQKSPLYPSFLAWVFFAAGLFMAHVLVLSSAHDGRRTARYLTYFDQAWKLFIQHVFSGAFLGALWLVLFLGGSLFKLIGLSFLQELLRESWVAIPISTFAIATGLHLTDVKPDIVHGIRNLLLTLLSWILPVITLLTGGFLISLPFTGLAPLWATKQATAVLLGTAAALVVLINTAFQNGQRGEAVPRVVRACARLGSVLLLPIVGIALYALSLRVGQYGWTSDRVIATACALVASAYAVGYCWAALDRRGWLQPVAHVNIWTTWLILAVLVALFSPLADPARLSVQDQLARLRDGRTKPEALDLVYLRFDAGRHGYEALQALAQGQGTGPQVQLARAAQVVLKKDQRWNARNETPAMELSAVRANIRTVWPKGAKLPESFLQTNWQAPDVEGRSWRLPACLRKAGTPCEAIVLSVDDDAEPEVLILQSGQNELAASLFNQDANQRWHLLTRLPTRLVTCTADRQRLQLGQFNVEPTRYRDLRIGDRRVVISADENWDRVDDKPDAKSDAKPKDKRPDPSCD